MIDVKDWAGPIHLLLPISANRCEENWQLALFSCIAPALINEAALEQPFLSAAPPANPWVGVTALAILLVTLYKFSIILF